MNPGTEKEKASKTFLWIIRLRFVRFASSSMMIHSTPLTWTYFIIGIRFVTKKRSERFFQTQTPDQLR